jgi:hypothetical protein
VLSEDSPNASRFCRNALSDKLADDFTGGALSLVGSNNVDGGREAFERAWKMRILVTSILALTAAPTSLSAGPTVSRCPFGRLRKGKLVLAQAGETDGRRTFEIAWLLNVLTRARRPSSTTFGQVRFQGRGSIHARRGAAHDPGEWVRGVLLGPAALLPEPLPDGGSPL